MPFHVYTLRSSAPRRFPSRVDGFALGTIMLAALALATLTSSNVEAATAANAKSPLGMNLVVVNYYTPEQPFLNIFKTEGVTKATPKDGWVTHSNASWDSGEEPYIQTDSDGYPTTLTASSSDPHSPQEFNSVGVLLLRSLSNSNSGKGLPYRSGKYVVLYDGQGTLTYGFDAKLVSSSPGRDIINVAKPSTDGIDLRITATDPNHSGNYIRNIRVVKAEEESLLNGGNVFAPAFLAKLQNFHALRFTAWSETGQPDVVGSWNNRTQPSDAGWGSSHGVPLEVEVQLANATGADPWFSIPHTADDDYITRMATLVHASLNKSQRVYVELSNEVWNGSFPQYSYAVNQGKAMWPKAGVSDYEYNRNWFGMRTAQSCDIWKSVWGSDWPRVVCVLAAQAAGPSSVIGPLTCILWTGSGNSPCAAHNITAVAIAPYFGLTQTQTISASSLASSLASSAASSGFDGGVSDIFQEPNMGTALKRSFDWTAAYVAALAPYKLPLIAYEGGQSLVGAPKFPTGSPLVNLYIAANRDSRMGAAYTKALKDWKSSGGQLYMLFNDVQQPDANGEWGALESFMDTVSPLTSAPPKWQAIENFISDNPCWWPECVGAIGPVTISAVPLPPTNVQVH